MKMRWPAPPRQTSNVPDDVCDIDTDASNYEVIIVVCVEYIQLGIATK